MNAQFNYQTVWSILNYLVYNNGGQRFYLDRPFINGQLMDRFHDVLLNMERAGYIKGYDNHYAGASILCPTIPRLGLRIQVLAKGWYFWRMLFSSMQ